MSPPTPIETLAKSLDSAFPVNYPIYEGDDISDAFSDIEADPVPDERSVKSTKSSSSRSSRKDKKERKKEKRLTERTSEILSTYRAFLHEHDMLETSPDPLNMAEGGLNELSYHNNRIKRLGSNGSSSSHGSDTGGSRLLRGFNTPDHAYLDYVEEGGISTRAKRRYKQLGPIVNSKRVKHGLIMGLGLIVIIAAVICTSVSKKSKRHEPTYQRGDPQGWHNEAAYILEHEKGDQAERLPHYTRIEPDVSEEPPTEPQEHVVDQPEVHGQSPESVPEENKSDSSEIVSFSTQTQESILNMEKNLAHHEMALQLGKQGSPNTETVETTVGKQEHTPQMATFDLGQILHDKFKPLWLSAKEGWNGGSHDEALQFCKNIRGKVSTDILFIVSAKSFDSSCISLYSNTSKC